MCMYISLCAQCAYDARMYISLLHKSVPFKKSYDLKYIYNVLTDIGPTIQYMMMPIADMESTHRVEQNKPPGIGLFTDFFQ